MRIKNEWYFLITGLLFCFIFFYSLYSIEVFNTFNYYEDAYFTLLVGLIVLLSNMFNIDWEEK